MEQLSEVAPAFVEMAHRIVWASCATVDSRGRPRSRVLHPIWEWDGDELRGWIATSPTAIKRAHLADTPFMSVNYWAPSQNICTAECRAVLTQDNEIRAKVWDLFAKGPAPVGYDPTVIPAWTSPTVDSFAVIRLEPWRLRVFPGTLFFGKGGKVLTWKA